MTEMFLEREFDPPLTRARVWEMVGESAQCFGMYRVNWCGSMLSGDGRRLFCHFAAVDAESVRTALRQSGGYSGRLWRGTVHEAPGLAGVDPGHSNVVVTRAWDEPVTLDAIQAIEDAGAWCLEAHEVTFVRTFFAADRKRMACLYRAPDAESVRLAQAQAGMPVERVWPFELVGPDPEA